MADSKRQRLRKTHLLGKLQAKYRGELDNIKERQHYINQRFFDIEIYEANLEEPQYRKEGEEPFTFGDEKGIVRLSHSLDCIVSEGRVNYKVTLHEIQLTNIDFESHRKLHQEEDGLVFGFFTADIIGYIYDMVEAESADVVVTPPPKPEPVRKDYTVIKETDTNGNVRWKPIYTGPEGQGCVETIWPILGFLFFVLFIGLIGINGLIALLSVAAVVLFIAFFSRIIEWLFRIFIVAMLLLFLYNLATMEAQRKHPHPIPFAQNDSTERAKPTVVKADTNNRNDSFIYHYRVWKDYEGAKYSGTIWVKKSAVSNCNSFKNSLQIFTPTEQGYDEVLHSLYAHDKDYLPGIYQLFDSLKTKRNLDSLRFAEVVVAFVQDIPYSLVVDQSCDPSLYTDNFTRSYLQSNAGDCDGYERFGINSPVEFMGNLKGDCDTRTLILYTILSHYNYDVAVLSSEFYSHSILAVNLPYTGKAKMLGDKRYVVWETTCPDIKPGLLPLEISDLNNWRFSLISKNIL